MDINIFGPKKLLIFNSIFPIFEVLRYMLLGVIWADFLYMKP